MKKHLLVISALLIAILCACGKSAPTWQEQYDLGLRYLSEGNYQEAILAFTAAIEIDPKQASAYVGRGDAYVLSGETDDNLTAARADYEQAIELDGSAAAAYLGLADVYIRQGDYDKALELLGQGLSATGSDASIADKITELESINGTGDTNNEDNGGETTEINGANIESIESEMAVLLRTGDNGNLITLNDISFYGADFRELSVDAAEAALQQAGLSTTREIDDRIVGSNHIRREHDLTWVEGPFVDVDHKNGIVTSWDYESPGGRELLNTGIRDICIGDSLKTVLSKIGFTTAEEIAQFAVEYYAQKYLYPEGNMKEKNKDWQYRTWKFGDDVTKEDEEKFIHFEFIDYASSKDVIYFQISFGQHAVSSTFTFISDRLTSLLISIE